MTSQPPRLGVRRCPIVDQNSQESKSPEASFAFAHDPPYLFRVRQRRWGARGVWLRAAVLSLTAMTGILLVSCGIPGRLSRIPLLKLLTHGSGLICFVGPDGNVFVVDQAGGGLSPLTADAGSRTGVTVVYTAPTWSPNGKRIAFVRFSADSSRTAGTAALLTARADGLDSETLFSSGSLRPFYLCWSPDSRKLSVLSQVQGEATLELGVVAAGAGYSGVDRGSPYYWDWLGDSASVAIHSNSGLASSPQEKLSILALGPQYERTDLSVDAGWFQSPAVSPNGKDLAYVARSPQGFSLRVRAMDGSADSVLTTGNGEAYFAFSRDGKRIAFLEAARTAPLPLGRLSIWDLSHKGGQSIIREGPVLAFFWAPDSRRLAFMVPDPGSDVDPLFLRSEGALTIRLMGWEAGTGRTWTIARFPISSGLLSILPFFDQYHRSATIWSPDSRSLVFTAFAADGTSGLFAARADGRGRPRFLASGDFAFWSWR